MNTFNKETRSREDRPDNYRKPGTASANAALGPSTREMLGLLSAFEAAAAG